MISLSTAQPLSKRRFQLHSGSVLFIHTFVQSENFPPWLPIPDLAYILRLLPIFNKVLTYAKYALVFFRVHGIDFSALHYDNIYRAVRKTDEGYH